MKGIKTIGVLAIAAASIAFGPAAAGQAGGWPEAPPQGPPPARGRGPGGRGPGMGRGPHENPPHIGQWLKKIQNLSPEEQEKALANDPEFQKLPPEQQNQLRERLRHFNSLPPEKRQRILERMDAFEHLTPEQQQQARQIFGQVRQLPDDRRHEFRKGMRKLAGMNPDQRLAAIDSPEFRGAYSDDERNLMRQVVKLNILPQHPAPDGPEPGHDRR